MFTALTLSLALGAPVPVAPTTPMATGVAPKVMELKANADGKIMVTARKTEKVQIGVGAAIAPANPGGGAVPPPAQITREVTVTKVVELGEIKDLSFTTADGKKLTTEEALKKIGTGAIVIVSGDGKPVSPAFLKVFKDDTLVLASPELAGPQGAIGGPIGRPGIRPLPAPLPPGGIQIVPAQGGVIQIQPGVIQVLPAPAVDLPLAVPAQPAQPAPAEKNPIKK